MSGSEVSLLGWSVVLVSGLLLEAAGRVRPDVPTASEVVTAAMRTASGRVLVLAAWLWLGVHFLAR